MRRMVCLLIVVCAFALLLITPSCKKVNATFVPIKVFSTPLQALINSDTTLSVFYAIVLKAKDTALYGGIDSVTVLIPNNTAFATQGITLSTVNAMSVASADSFLRYHYIPVYDSLATPGSTIIFTSKLGPGIVAFLDSSNTYFNGVLGIRQNLPGSNATVFELSAPLQIQQPSAAQIIASDTSLVFFTEALKHTAVNITPSSGWNTILAPIDSAFMAAGYSSVSSIDTADITRLTNILQYNMLPGQYFTSSFIGLSTVSTVQGTNLNIIFNNEIVQFYGNTDTSAASIVIPNRIAASNIVIHSTNKVLMP